MLPHLTLLPPHPVCQQGCCLTLLGIIAYQHVGVRRSHWARHWACAMDVLELIAAESAADDALVAGCLDVTVAREIIADIVANELLKEYVVQLTAHQYNPGDD